MTEGDVRKAIEAERGELADILAGLDESEWDKPSLCAGWRVREVVAHITMPFRMSLPTFGLEMMKARGNFNKMADRVARRETADISSAAFVKCLRDNITHPWKPPGGKFEDALGHDIIHGLDITVALGLDRVVPEDRLRYVISEQSPKSIKFFGVDLNGVELRADDMDWTYGSGEPLTGRAQDLLLVQCGRKLPPGHLHGAAAGRFTSC
ncbi:maleylpyruvate isomerase family mycothiol-dependent enzyme [Nocardia sp. XZ_19_385]|uniref:maleylpyruvate isomerase family mycothiol-dependent enzyme n=1 Tax=Nocardia sp. XZ_19_385 TaxID=2769488 RepID=UPI0018908E8F|nr:maleylpyruvate isomerase family mycothiol-dependent enzyme [Nocardia sp. XZ_19_385]